MFVAGFILAALPDVSLIGFLGADAGYVEEAFRQMVQLVLAGFENDALFEVFRSTSLGRARAVRARPHAHRALPRAGAQLTRLQGASLGLRLGVAAGGAFVFALLMLIPALLTGNVNADVGQVFGYAPPVGADRRRDRPRCSPPRPRAPPTASPRAGAASPRRP